MFLSKRMNLREFFTPTARAIFAVPVFLFLLIPFLAATPRVMAQEPAQAAWLVSRFDVTANLDQAGRRAVLQTVLTARNVGRGNGASLTVRLTTKAEVKGVTVNDTTANFRLSPEPRGNLQRATITLPASIAPDGTAVVAVDYVLPIAKNEGGMILSPLGSQFLPAASWYPTPNTIYAPRGADVAPVRLTVNGLATGETLLAAGVADGATITSTLYGQPFFLTGSFEKVTAGNAGNDAAYLFKGAGATEKARAQELLTLAQAARTYYAGLLGPAPAVPLQLAEVSSGGGFSGGGVLLLNPAAFRIAKLDAGTGLQLAEAVAQLWTEGATAVRGEGAGVIRNGLTRYLALQFIEKQFGADAANAEWERGRAAHRRAAANEAPLALTTPLDGTYYTSTAFKGAAVWRLAAHLLGREVFLNIVREQFTASRDNFNGVTLAQLREALNKRGGEAVRQTLDEQFAEPTTLDLLIGLPQQQGAQWTAALRNTGAFGVTVPVMAWTDKGQQLTVDVTLPPRDFGTAVFATPDKVTRVVLDPAKYYPQTDYVNDSNPRTKPPDEARADVTVLYNRQDFANTEKTAREMLAVNPQLPEVQVYLARALLAENRAADAEKEFRAVLETKLPTAWTQAWAALGLGDIATQRKQNAEALKFYSEAVNADAEYASTLAARNLRVSADAAASLDESAKAFIAQLDTAIKGGRKQDLDALIVPGELTDFVKGLVGSQPEIWSTRVLRTEPQSGERLVVDVALTTRTLGKDQSGTAVYTLARTGSAWRLARIELFEVR